MSAGNAVGAVVGAVVGFFVGGPAGALKGASFGYSLGGMVAPPKGPNVNGPRLTDLTFQSSGYNAVIPRAYGTIALTGNIFWLENNQLKEVSKKSKSGGKGGKKSTVTTYSYYATFAVGLCEGPIAGVRRIWIGPTLIYDASSSDLGALIETNNASSGFTIYNGSDTQSPDPRMQATLGVANTPAYRGLAYIVFKDLALRNYGNTLQGAQIKVEVVQNGSISEYQKLSSFIDPNPYATIAIAQCAYSLVGSNLYYAKPINDTRSPGGMMEIWKLDIYTNTPRYVRTVSVQNATWGIGYGKNYDGTIAFGTQDYNPGVCIGSWVVEDTLTNDYGSYHTIRGNRYYTVRDNCNMLEYEIGSQNLGFIRQYVAPFAISPKGWGCDSSAEFVYFGVAQGTQVLKFKRSTGNFVSFANIAASQGFSVASDNEIYYVNGTSLYVTTDFFTSSTLIASDIDFQSGSVANYPFAVFSIAPKIIAVTTQSQQSMTISIIKYSKTILKQNIELSYIVSSECLKAIQIRQVDIDSTALTQEVRGYRVGRVTSLKTTLEPLQATWPFDIMQSGYKLKFRPRASASTVITIPAKDLGATEGD